MDADRQPLMESLDAALEALRRAGKPEVRLLADELDDIVRRVGAIVWQPKDVPDAPTGVAGTAADGAVSADSAPSAVVVPAKPHSPT